MDSFLLQATIYLGTAVVAVPLAARLGLGSVLGYLAAGIIIGPGLGLVGHESEDLRHFGEFGVVMMLFLIGLELEPQALWDMRRRLVGMGGLQVVGTTLVIAGGAFALGLDWPAALAAGMIFGLSSTAIVLQTLTERGLMQTAGGRSSFSVLLTQDIAVIPMLALIPLLGHGAAVPEGEVALSLVEGRPGWQVTLITLAAVGAIILVGTYLTRPVFHYIHKARLREMYTALALLMVVSIAVLMGLVGLSPALGTFLAGVVLANTEFRHELEGELQPFKGLLLGLFFITVGSGIDFAALMAQPGLILGLTAAVIAVKGVILYALARVFHLRGRDRFLFTFGLAQAGEFGFVLISFALAQGVFGAEVAQVMLLIVALSMLVTPLLFLAYGLRTRDMRDASPAARPDDIDEDGPVIIAGIGRFGQTVNRLVQGAGFRTVLLDNDLAVIETMRRFGYRGFFGDPSRPEILHAAGLDKARVLVVALDDKAATVRVVTYARRLRPDLHIVARAYDRVHVYELYQAGADDIVREMFDSSLRAGRYVLENMGLSEYEAAQSQQTFYHMDRAAMKDLAELWQPGVPIDQNPAYVARARVLNKDLESALMSQLALPGEAVDDALPLDDGRPQDGEG